MDFLCHGGRWISGNCRSTIREKREGIRRRGGIQSRYKEEHGHRLDQERGQRQLRHANLLYYIREKFKVSSWNKAKSCITEEKSREWKHRYSEDTVCFLSLKYPDSREMNSRPVHLPDTGWEGHRGHYLCMTVDPLRSLGVYLRTGQADTEMPNSIGPPAPALQLPRISPAFLHRYFSTAMGSPSKNHKTYPQEHQSSCRVKREQKEGGRSVPSPDHTNDPLSPDFGLRSFILPAQQEGSVWIWFRLDTVAVQALVYLQKGEKDTNSKYMCYGWAHSM